MRTIWMLTHATVLLGIVACSHAAPPAPPPPAPAPPPAPVAPVAPVAETAALPGWTSCLISRKELEAELHKPADIAPVGGYVLALFLVERTPGSTQSYRATIGLAKEPGPSETTAITGMIDDSLDEHGAGVETTYEIHGSLVASADGAKIELTLASSQQPHMFDGPPLRQFSVALRRIHHVADCP